MDSEKEKMNEGKEDSVGGDRGRDAGGGKEKPPDYGQDGYDPGVVSPPDEGDVQGATEKKNPPGHREHSKSSSGSISDFEVINKSDVKETGQAPKDVEDGGEDDGGMKDGGVDDAREASGEDTIPPPSTSSQGNDEAGSQPEVTSRIIDVDEPEPMDTDQDPEMTEGQPGYNAENYEENRRITRSMVEKDEDQQKSQGFVRTTITRGFNQIMGILGGNNQTKKEAGDPDPTEPVSDENEEVTEAQFASLVEVCPEDEIVVRFHIMIPSNVPFTPNQDKLVICGLGNWSTSHDVELNLKKSVNGKHLMVGFKTLKRIKVVGKVLEYKYKVVPQSGESWYEDLRPQHSMSHSHIIWNRALKIPEYNKDKSYEKYDDVILEDNSERKKMRELATKSLLPSLKKIIKNGDYHDLHAKAMKFRDVVESHISGIGLIEQGDSEFVFGFASYHVKPSLSGYDVECRRLLQAWADNYFKKIKEKDLPRKASVYAALFYLSLQSILPRYLPDLKEEYYQIIVGCLHPNLSPDGGKCRTLEIIASIIQKEHRESLAENIEMALGRIAKFKYFKRDPSTLFLLLPVVHFLRGYKQPATLQEAVEKNGNAQYWGFNKIPIEVKNPLQSLDYKEANLLLDQVKTLSKTDRVLKFSFLRCLSFESFSLVLQREDLNDFFGLPSLLACSLTWLHRDERLKVDHKSLARNLKDCLSYGLSQQKENNDVNYIKDLCFGSKKFFAEMHSLDVNDALNSSMEILVLVHRHYKAEADARNDDVFNLTELDQVAEKYVGLQKKRIYGFKDLIQMLSDSIKLFSGLDKMVGVVLHHLNIAINSGRYKNEIVDAYLDLGDLHPSVEEKVKDRALNVGMEGINNIGFIDKFKDLFTDQTKMSKYTEFFAKAFGSSVKDLDVENEAELIKYVLGDKTIENIFLQEKNCKDWLQRYFPVREFGILQRIVSKFISILDRAKDGEIEIGILRMVTPVRLKTSGLPLASMLEVFHADPEKTMLYLELRTEELDYYEMVKGNIVKLLSKFNDGRIRNYSEQIDKFPGEKELDGRTLADICHPRGELREEISLKIESVYLENYRLIEKTFDLSSSVIFNDSIEDAIDNLSSLNTLPNWCGGNSDDSEDDVDEEEQDDPDVQLLFRIIRQGIFSFESIGKSLSDLSMPLRDVEKYFRDYKTDIPGIELELIILEDFLSLEVNHDWSEKLGRKIECFFQLGNYKEAAVILTNVARRLGIEKPFSCIAKILQIQDLQNEEATIAEITEQDLKCGAILSQWTREDFKALEAVEKSMNLIEWIRDSMDNFQQFKVFVDLASISAGESDIEVDRIQIMQASISAYSALIFDIGAKSDFQGFRRAMDHLVNALRKDKQIPQKLIDTNHHLAWIKVIKEQQGSVETSSLQQVTAINSTGKYYVGNLRQGGRSSLRLRFQQVQQEKEFHGRKEYEKELTEEDLKELQSKLMLISKSSESRSEVEEFVRTLMVAMRLKRSLKKLFEAGCNLTRMMCITFYCNVEKKVKVEIDFRSSGLLTSLQPINAELPRIADFLDSAHEDWCKHLAQLRIKYPATSYYRTDQLVELARSTAKCLRGQPLSHQARMLLNKMSHDVTEEEIRDLFKSDERRGSYSDEEDLDLTPAEMIKMLREEYSVRPKLAEAAVAAVFKSSENPNLEKCFEWTLDNEALLSEEDIDEMIREFRAQIEREEAENAKPTMDDLTRKMIETTNAGAGQLSVKLTKIWNCFLSSIETEEASDFVNFEKLGEGLDILNQRKSIPLMRKFPECLTPGKPNLVVTTTEKIHNSCLTLYCHDPNKPLPYIDEVLVCNEKTSAEDVELLCRRAFNDQEGNKIFCVLYSEKLNFDTSMRIENLLMNSDIRNRNYRLVFICCQSSSYSYLTTALDKYKVEVPDVSRERLRSYIYTKLRTKNSVQDPTSVRLVQSDRPGNGKSRAVQNAAQRLSYSLTSTSVHDLKVDESAIISWLMDHSTSSQTRRTVYHIDLSSDGAGSSRNDLMFCLGILRGLEDQQGRVWTCDLASDVYMFEKTGPSEKEFATMLPRTFCLSPQESLQNLLENNIEKSDSIVKLNEKSTDLFQHCDENQFNSPGIQRPTQYLNHFFQGVDLDQVYFIPRENNLSQRQCLSVLLDRRACPIHDPTYSELLNFTRFLNVQLEECEKSVFCTLQQDWSNLRFKNLVVKFLILMTQDFSTRSVDISDESSKFQPKISDRRKWESSHHPYIFLNEDSTITFFGVAVDRYMNLINPETGKVLEERIMSPNLYQLLVQQSRGDQIPMFLSQDFDRQSSQVKLRLLCRILGVERENLLDPNNMNGQLRDPDPTYKLTADNVKKLLATFMRMKANIPVVIMGETGCGKTRMVKYLCDLMRGGKNVENMILIKAHGGLSRETIKNKVDEAIRVARDNYVKHNVKMTIMFFDEANTTANIGFIKDLMVDRKNSGVLLPEDSTLQFICAVNPYRVHTPEMIEKLESSGLGYHIQARQTEDRIGTVPLRQLVYRVHQLPIRLFDYVFDFGQPSEADEREYVQQMVRNTTQGLQPDFCKVLVDVICRSQKFMRGCSFECSFVSLRDVERLLKIFQWFTEKSPLYLHKMREFEQIKDSGFPYESLTILLLAVGVNYYSKLDKERNNYALLIADLLKIRVRDILPRVVDNCQDVFIEEIRLESDIARNDALKENVWMMVISIELGIPLFIVGKPGSSKSLAKTVVCDVMQGPNSYSDMYKNLKEVHMVSFQCSPLATSDGIIGTFRQCQKYQAKKDLTKLTSVVILDEVGLAEDSPKMPLKALHPLLEDGCIEDDKPTPDKKVAFIGISNWALDPAKMNRAILLQRTPPDRNDLIKIGKGIGDKTCQKLTDHLIPDLADGYLEVYNAQEKEYFGLRDFYSLVKMISSEARKKSKKKLELNWKTIESCVRRNFGGYFGDFNPSRVFLSKIKSIQQRSHDHDQFSSKELLEEALQAENNRYLLILTKNNAALRILQLGSVLNCGNFEILFGSSFSGDLEYTQICHNINRIKIHMETGQQVVLVNLESLYESLYDALNQSYSWMGGNRYVDLGLGTHRVKCRVHPDFRLILVAEEEDVRKRFPIPLINRLEKHYLGMETILDRKYSESVEKLKVWVMSFCEINIPDYRKAQFKQFTPRDVFIGYHEDVFASLLMQYGNDLEDLEDIESKVKHRLLESATPASIMRLHQTELSSESEELFTQYFQAQSHDSLASYLQSLPQTESNFVEVSTHSKLLTQSAKNELAESLNVSRDLITLLAIQQFNSEEEFRKQIYQFFEKGAVLEGKTLIIQIDGSEEKSRNLIESARYILHSIINEVSKHKKKINVLMIIHLQFSSGGYVGFPCHPWKSVHIDTISPPLGQPLMVRMMRGRSIFDIVKTEVEEDVGILPLIPLIESLVPKAASLVKGGDPDRSVCRIDKFLQSFRKNNVFRDITKRKLVELLELKDSQLGNSTSWLSTVSLYSTKLKEGSTYQSAVWHRLQESLAPLLAIILSNIDCNHNLDLLTSPDRWRVELFLRMYNSVTFDLAQEVTLLRSGPKEFKVKLPFSWSLIQTVHSVQMMPGYLQSEELVNMSPVLKHLQEAVTAGGMKLVEDYVSDLVNSSINVPSFRNGKLIEKWIISEILRNIRTEELDPSEDEGVEPQRDITIAKISPQLIDSVFNQLKQNIDWFNQLTSSYPEIVNDVINSVQGDSVETPLSQISLKFAIKTLTPPWDKFEEEVVREEWKKKVYHLQSVAQQMKEETGEDSGMWREWTQCVVFLNFIQNVLNREMDQQLKLSVCSKLKTVWMALKDPDLKKHGSFKKLVQILKIINVQAAKVHFQGGVNECVKCQEVPNHPVALPCAHIACRDCLVEYFEGREDKRCPNKKCKSPRLPEDFVIETSVDAEEAVRKHETLRKSLNIFFLNVLKTFCFAANEEPPEKKILESLLEFVTHKSIDGEDVGVRTKELSPFAEHGIDATPTIRSYLLQLCLQSDQRFSNDLISDFMAFKQKQVASEDEMVELVHLYMNCVEDISVRDRGLVFRAPLQWDEDTDLSDLDKLNELSQCKVALEKLAVSVVTYFENPETSQQELQIINAARRSLVKSPPEFKRFLVKEICFKHRADVISEMKKSQMIELLPEELLQNDDDVEDIFNIAGSLYPKTKEMLRKFFVNKNPEELQDFLENNDEAGVRVLVLALFNTVITSIADVKESCEELLQSVQKFSKIQLAPILTVRNMTGSGHSQRDVDLIKIAFIAKTVSELTDPNHGLAEFFSTLIKSPESLTNKFLPSMPHDVKYKVLQAAIRDVGAHGGQMKYYQCPAGHVYGISDCTQPNAAGKCADCGAAIGGSVHGRYQLQPGNRVVGAMENGDNTQPGYILKGDEKLTEGVRMTLFDTEFFRMLFHLGCLAGLQDKSLDVSLLCGVGSDKIEQFLLDQINANIAKCARLANLSQDNIMILLADFMLNLPASNQGVKFNLLTQNGRSELEKAFITRLQYCVRSRSETVDRFKTVTKEDAEKSALQDLLTVDDEDSSRMARLLRVRSRVTGDNFLQWMITNNLLTSCPTLGRLLKDLTVLQELVNLPQILQLQSQLLDRFSGKVSSTEMEGITIRDFSERLDQNYQARYLQLAEIVLQTWNNLKGKIGEYGGIMAEEVMKTQAFREETNTARNTPAAFLFPASKGSGLCSYALVMLMIDQHNMVTRSNLPTLSPYQASVLHLSTFSRAELQSLLLSHTSYTFPRSGLTREEYDVQGMERKVKERFDLSNPRLDDEVIRKVQYLEDRSGKEEDLLTNKIPQTELDNNVQHQLEMELRQLPDLCQLLESVCTARDFLLEVGGEQDRSLPQFMAKLRLYIGDESSVKNSPLRHFSLCHVDSLIKFMGLVRAKVMIKNLQNPFEQDIPLEYRVSLDSTAFIPDLLKSVSPQWLLPNLYTFIWAKLRQKPTGENVGQPEWPLRDTLEAFLEEEKFCSKINDKILCKHAVDLFISVNNFMFDRQ